MHERIRFMTHSGKQILLVDMSNCSAAEVENIARSVPEYVTAQPLDSVLLLADLTGALFDKQCVQAMKEAAVFDKPHIRRSAWVGAERLPKVFYDNLKSFSRREFPIFQNRPEALEWLLGSD